MIVPRITTRRLLLRELRRSDFDAYAACLAETPEPHDPINRREAWRRLSASSGAWLLDGTGWWGIELVATSELVGTVGAFYREAHPERETTDRDLELGWTIFADFRRRGFATEAATAALAFSFESRRETRVIAHIDADNEASIRVSKSLGMHYERNVSFYGLDLGLYVASRI
jgi:RimJ/RimL family protein N-acetyltransferase